MDTKKSTLRILHVISDLRRGGRERQLATLVAHSDKTSLDHHIVCFYRAPGDYMQEFGLSEKVTCLESKNRWNRWCKILHTIRRKTPDIVFAWGSNEFVYVIVAYIAYPRFKPVNGAIRHGIRLNKPSHLIRMMILHLSPFIVANSKAGLRANHLQHRAGRYVLYNGVAPKFGVQPTAKMANVLCERLAISSDSTVLLSVANFVPYKDYFSVLHALKRLTDAYQDRSFVLVALGSGPLKDAVEDLARELRLSDMIRFPGRVNDVEDYLCIADIFVHSSKGEGCSNAIIEAMYQGCPIIAAATGGTSEVVNPSFGELFHYQDVDSLYQKLQRVLFQRNLLQMGRAAEEAARKRFNVAKMVKKFKTIANDIVTTGCK